MLSEVLQDSHQVAGWGLGHTTLVEPFPFRFQRVDYVWYGQGLTAVNTHIGQTGGSDHHPVITTLQRATPP